MNTASMQNVAHHMAVLSLSASLGFCVGRLLAIPSPYMVLEPDTRPPVPVVHIDGVRDGLLHGSVFGNARVSLGDTIVVQSGAFAVPAEILLRNEVQIFIPSGVRFVASKRGKKYYDVSSAAGEKIVPGNRVYFETAAQAEAAGFVP